MSSDSRTSNTVRNIKHGFINKMALLVAAFVARTVFIRLMGAEYTGISSLYSNILSLLNLADLGFASVLTYELYKPLRDHDEETIRALVTLFRKIYLVVFAVVVGIGVALIPFLQFIVNSDLDTFHLYLYYVLYLADSASSYFIVHNRMVVRADQKYYVVNTLDVICKFIQYIVQTVYLVLTHDFVGYLVIQVMATILYNILVNATSIWMYPFLRGASGTTVSDETIRRIKVNVKATFIEKISQVVLNQTDSIIISMMFGTIFVGYYSNYNLIVYYLSTILYSVVVVGIEASVGNLNAEGDLKQSYRLYRQLDLLMSFVNMFFVVEFVCIIQDFVHVWIGDEYVQSYILVAALMTTFYLQESMNLITIYRQTLGLFDKVKTCYIAMAVLNIILSLILGKFMGVPGVVIATGLSRLISAYWREGQVVFRRLGLKERAYYWLQFRSILITLIVLIISFGLCSFMGSINVYARIVLKSCIALFVSAITYYIVYHRTEEWAWAVQLIKDRLRL